MHEGWGPRQGQCWGLVRSYMGTQRYVRGPVSRLEKFKKSKYICDFKSNNEWYIGTMMVRLKLTDDKDNENEDFWWCLSEIVQVLCRPCFNKNTRQRRGICHIGVLIWVRNLGLRSPYIFSCLLVSICLKWHTRSTALSSLKQFMWVLFCTVITACDASSLHIYYLT